MRKKTQHSLMATAFLSLAIALFSVSSSAVAYPDRPLSLSVAYSPGGATDFQARIVTMVASSEDYFGQPIVILNRPGAGGRVGWDHFASKARLDGYELSAYNVPHFIAQSIKFDTKYDIENLEPIANWGADPAVLIVGKDSPFNSVDDLVKYARENPNKVTFSGAGLYVGHHIAFLQIKKATDVELTYVPHKGGAPALTSVIGGQVMAGVNNLSDAYRSRDSLKILAVADNSRNADFLPDVATFKELGYEVDDSSVNFRGVMVRKGTPKAVVDYLAEIFPKMFNNSRVVSQMAKGGSPLRVMNRDEVKSMWEKRQIFLEELLKDL